MTVEVADSAEFYLAEAEAKVRGQRILTLKRGKQGNASWVLVLSDPVEQPDLLAASTPTRHRHEPI